MVIKVKEKVPILTGTKVGRLTVVRRAEDVVRNEGGFRPAYFCICDCGGEKVVLAKLLKGYDGKGEGTGSCGCMLKEHNESGPHAIKHGKSRDKEYSSWRQMKKDASTQNINTTPNTVSEGYLLMASGLTLLNSTQTWGIVQKVSLLIGST